MNRRTIPFTLLAIACIGRQLTAQADQSIEGIGPATKIELVQGKFQFLEGPADDGAGTLYFTDIPAKTIFRLSSRGKITPLTTESGHANGLMFDASGDLLACQMDGQLVRIDLETKTAEVLASEYQGKRFNAPNDLDVDAGGGIYFTDPLFRAPTPLPQSTQGFYYRASDGTVIRLDENLPAPNGIALSPDQKTLYVVPSKSAEMLAYDVRSPGKLANRRVLCRLKQQRSGTDNGGDGMAVDSKGNLYITAATGVQVFNPAGKFLGNIEIPEHPANVTFGGPDRKTLYVTARTGLYRCRMFAQGKPQPIHSR